MHYVKRDTMLGDVVYDDLWYTCSLILSLHHAANISQRMIVTKIKEQGCLSRLFRTACISHTCPYDSEVASLAERLFGDKEINLCNVRFTRDFYDSHIYACLIKDLFFETSLDIVNLFYRVYMSDLSDWCIDKSTAWTIVPSNQLLYESFGILGLEEYFDNNKIYT